MSILTTQKELRELPVGIAIDITSYDDKACRELRDKEGWFNEIAWSRGLYGCNGLLFQGNNTKQLYKIVGRTTSLFCI